LREVSNTRSTFRLSALIMPMRAIDPAKQRIRSWLCDINDERLLSFGLTPEDIALLRGSGGSGGSGNFVNLLRMGASSILFVPSPPGSWF
jgi:hypothetical protein